MPTNFFSALVASKQTTRHLTVGVELPFMKRVWLYVIDVDHFPDGTVVMNPMRIFAADARGAFTVSAARKGDAWTLPGFPGFVMPPGHITTRVVIAPDTSGARWTGTLIMKREREPVMR